MPTAQANSSRQIKFPDSNPRSSGQWVYHPGPEEIPVTFQVGIVANDGIILASDKRARHTPGARQGVSAGVNSGTLTDKIVCSVDPRMAYCWAGDNDIMSAIIRAFLSSPISPTSPEHILRSLEEASWVVWEQMYGPRVAQQQILFNHQEGSLLLAYSSAEWLELFRLGFSRYPSVKRVYDKTVEGDCANAAAFFLERYYRRLTVEALLPLAAHCILMGAKLNETGIEGLELAICTREKCELLTDVSEVRRFSDKLDSEIAKMMGADN